MHHLELFDVEIKELFLSVAILNLEWIGLKPKKNDEINKLSF